MPILEAPENGVTVRMYRIGHGDCFLLALPGKDNKPYYVLIDCGYKPGSTKFLPNKKVANIIDHIGESTDYTIDLVVITHEHQDHVNAFWKKRNPYFEDFTIKEVWLAWTENPRDRLANKFRKKHKDVLVSLVEARNNLGMALDEDNPVLGQLDNLLNLEFGGTAEDSFNLDGMRLAARDPRKAFNKLSMKYIKDKAPKNVKYLNPGDYKTMPATKGISAYVLGPPRRESLLRDEDPVGDEGFPTGSAHHFSFNASVNPDFKTVSPFRREYRVKREDAFGHGFFAEHYGNDKNSAEETNEVPVPDNASWRRIDDEWLFAAESLALKLNEGINNTSLVLAFELPKSKKVLLFAADAQRGSWVSWDRKTFKRGNETIDAKDILGRTVLYKAGHHGSHNATLNGELDDKYANLSWMGQGAYAQEFTAMITAVREWALTGPDKPWNHPLPAIKEALLKKAQGRVFQTDTGSLTKDDDISQTEWDDFMSRTKVDDLYFDYVIKDEL